ncbi:unnamed protein product, partial [Citrullus colocynthis]
HVTAGLLVDPKANLLLTHSRHSLRFLALEGPVVLEGPKANLLLTHSRHSLRFLALEGPVVLEGLVALEDLNF